MIPFGETTDILIKRRAVGSYNSAGVYVPGAEITTEATASVQPVTGIELEQLATGDRSRHPIRLYTTSSINIGDVLTVFGTDYEAHKIMNYTTHSFLRHYKVIALRKTYEGQR